MSFGPHEIVSVVFLVIFTILTPFSIFLWIKHIRAGYSWRSGFYGATLCCICRLGAFISELIFYGQHYGGPQHNYNAAIAYNVMLSIGYIGLLKCESSLFLVW